jgi:hypothetical protein
MMKQSKPKLTKAGKKIVAGLKEIAETLERGVPMDRQFTVRRSTDEIKKGGSRTSLLGK